MLQPMWNAFMAGQKTGDCHGASGFGGQGMGLFFLLFLVLLLRGDGFGGLGGNSGVAAATEAASRNNAEFDTLLNGQQEIRSQMNYGNLDQKLNNLGNGICDTNYAINNSLHGIQSTLCQGFSGIDKSIMQGNWQVADKINNAQFATQLGFQNLGSELAKCCCEQKTAMLQGFNAIEHGLCMQTNTLTNSMNAGFQSIKDILCCERTQDLRDRLAASEIANSQLRQTQELIERLGEKLKS